MTLRLFLARHGYELQDPESRQRPLAIDFTSARLRHRTSAGGKELLAKAVDAKSGVSILDCTAGLGVDSFILASKGCRVTMVERSHSLYLMLADALLRLQSSEVAAESDIGNRMSVVRGEARWVMSRLDEVPDVILIDPMFPARKKHAEVRGELQRLKRLLGTDEEVGELLKAARATGAARVVVKRPLRGGKIEGTGPAFSITGKASRFDVFVR